MTCGRHPDGFQRLRAARTTSGVVGSGVATRDVPGTTFTDPTLTHVGRMVISGGGAGGVIGAVIALLLLQGTGGGLDPAGAAAIGAFVGLPIGTVTALLAAVVLLRLRRRRPDLRARSQRLVLLTVCATSTLVATLALTSLLGMSGSNVALVVVTATVLTLAATTAAATWCLAPILPRTLLAGDGAADRS
jgi:hypothetical protein